MGPGGALETLIEAREEGLARFIGVTGHGWTIAAMHRRSLARFDFDAVLLPYNFFMAQEERYRRDFEKVLSVCRERNVAVQVIKSIARGPWAAAARTHTTWYQPLEEQADIDRAVHWVLGLPGVFLNTADDLTLLSGCWTPRAASSAAHRTTRWQQCATRGGSPRSSASRPEVNVIGEEREKGPTARRALLRIGAARVLL